MNVYHFRDPREKRMNICPNSMFKKFFLLSLSEEYFINFSKKKKKKKKMSLVPLAHSERETSGRSYPLPPRALSTEPASLPHASGAPGT